MKCPRCNKLVRRFNSSSTGAPLWMCTACGWTQDESTKEENQPIPEPPPAWLLLLGWAFSFLLLAGPYVALLTAFPRMPAWAHVVYWICAAMYVAAAAVETPDFDPNEMGLFGTMIDNPFSFEDDINRAKLKLTIFLFPGKIVWATIEGSWRRLRGIGVR